MTWHDKLTGYRRTDGRAGVRNFVLVMAAADNVNPLARKLAETVPGVLELPAAYGRGQLGEDFEITLRSMAGLAAHPNVSGCLIVCFEPEAGQKIAARAEALGRPAQSISLLQEGGMVPAFQKGCAVLESLLEAAAAETRGPIKPADLVVGLECGGSDTTSGLFGNPSLGVFADEIIDLGATAVFSEPLEALGGEALLEARARTPEAAREMIRVVHHYNQIARDQGVDLAGTNPTPDNMAGGLTTIEEKSLGALAKTGTRPIEGVVKYGEAATHAGLWMMDAPAAAVENLTAIAAGGAQILLFVTGSGNPVGHPLAPTLKITANPETAQTMPYHIDVDLSDGLMGGFTTREGGGRVANAFAEAVNGAETAAEKLGYVESRISRFGESV